MKQNLYRSMTFAAMWLLGVAVTACAGRPAGQGTPEAQAERAEVSRQGAQDGGESFPFPDIPEVMTDPDERRSYLLSHYWDRYDFADTALLQRAEVTEQGLVNYVALVASHPDGGEADRAVDGFCRSLMATSAAQKVFPDLLEKYLYDPMSPLRNDALYVRFLDGLLAHAPKENALRDRWRFYRELAGKNNPGQPAQDFTYYLPDGQKRTLYGTAAKQLLLFFYDPECENCHETLLEMKASAGLAEAVRDGRMTVLAIYTEGNPAVWQARLDEMPADWVVGTDREVIKTRSLYDLKAMPTLYLLDGDKHVLRKDAGFGGLRIEN